MLVGGGQLPQARVAYQGPAPGQGFVELDEVLPQLDCGEVDVKIIRELLEVHGGAVLGWDEAEERVGRWKGEDVRAQDGDGRSTQGLVVMTDIKLGVEERVGHGVEARVSSLTVKKENIYLIKTFT